MSELRRRLLNSSNGISLKTITTSGLPTYGRNNTQQYVYHKLSYANGVYFSYCSSYSGSSIYNSLYYSIDLINWERISINAAGNPTVGDVVYNPWLKRYISTSGNNTNKIMYFNIGSNPTTSSTNGEAYNLFDFSSGYIMHPYMGQYTAPKYTVTGANVNTYQYTYNSFTIYGKGVKKDNWYALPCYYVNTQYGGVILSPSFIGYTPTATTYLLETFPGPCVIFNNVNASNSSYWPGVPRSVAISDDNILCAVTTQGSCAVLDLNQYLGTAGNKQTYVSSVSPNVVTPSAWAGEMDIAYGNGLFVAVSYGKITYSTDAANWTDLNVDTSICFDDIIFVDNKFIIRAYNSSNIFTIEI